MIVFAKYIHICNPNINFLAPAQTATIPMTQWSMSSGPGSGPGDSMRSSSPQTDHPIPIQCFKARSKRDLGSTFIIPKEFTPVQGMWKNRESLNSKKSKADLVSFPVTHAQMGSFPIFPLCEFIPFKFPGTQRESPLPREKEFCPSTDKF